MAYDKEWLADALYSAAVGGALGLLGGGEGTDTKKTGETDVKPLPAPGADRAKPTAEAGAKASADVEGVKVPEAVEGVKPLAAPGVDNEKTAPVEGTGENTRLTVDDLAAYMMVGDRQHVRNQKERIRNRGQSPILTKASEIVDFIKKSFVGEIRDEVRAYGRVGEAFADRVRRASKGDVSIDGYYLELDSNMIAHLDDHVEVDKDVRSIPLTEEQLWKQPEYIDTFDDLIDVIRWKDGSVRLMLGKKINGHSIIIETVSKGRSALHPVTAYQIDSGHYERNYKTKAVDRSSTSQPANADQVDISRQATTSRHSVPEKGLDVNAENAGDVRPLAAPGLETEAETEPVRPLRRVETGGSEVEGYLDALAQDENEQNAPVTREDIIYDAKLRRLQQEEAPPERKQEPIAKRDLDELVELYQDIASPVETAREVRWNRP